MTLVLRGVLACCSAAIVIWCMGEAREATRFAALEAVSGKMAAGYEFNPKALSPLVPVLRSLDSQPCGAALAWSGIISMRMAQDCKAAGATAEEAEHANRAWRHLERYLACAPADAYAWLLLFWSKYEPNPDAKLLPLLAQSYALAPREGWMMPVRNAVAMPLYARLDAGTQRRTRDEYATLVRERPDAAVALYSNFDAAARAVVTPILNEAPQPQRTEIITKLDTLGVEVPVKNTR